MNPTTRCPSIAIVISVLCLNASAVVGPTVENAARDAVLDDIVRSADNNDANAQLIVGGLCFDADRRDYDLALRHFRRAAELGNANASNVLELLAFTMSSPDAFRTNRNDAVARAVRANPDKAARLLRLDYGIGAVDDVLTAIKRELTPRDGKWRGLATVDDWVQNVRTNKQIMTYSQYVSTRLFPFVCRELVPLATGDDEESKRLRALGTSIARQLWMFGEIGFVQAQVKEARDLLAGGCRHLLPRWLDAIANPRATAVEKLRALGKADDVRESRQLRDLLVAAGLQHHEGSKENVARAKTAAIEWCVSRRFNDEESTYVFSFISCLVTGEFKTLLGTMRDRDGLSPIMRLLFESVAESQQAWADRGGGYANTVTDEGWEGFEKHGGIGRAGFEKIMKDYPNLPFYGAGQAMKLYGGDPEGLDAILEHQSSIVVDWPVIRRLYAFYALYPRWGGSVEQLRRFADVCYDTGRHDTLIPLDYAVLHYEIAEETEVPTGTYFSDPEIYRKTMEVCGSAAWNSNFLAAARCRAFHLQALVNLRTGHYSELGVYRKYWRGFPIRNFGRTGFVVELLNHRMAMAALGGPNSERLVPLYQLRQKGRFAEFLDGVGKLGQDIRLEDDEREMLDILSKEAILAGGHGTNGHVSANFLQSGELSQIPNSGNWGVCNPGGGQRPYLYCSRSYRKKAILRWTVQLPSDFEIAADLRRSFTDNTAWVTFKPYSEFSTDSDPHVTVYIDKGRIGAYLGGRWRAITAQRINMKWVKSEDENHRVRIRFQGHRISVWLDNDDKPLIESDEYGEQLDNKRRGEMRIGFFGQRTRLYSLDARAL